jgi:phospholipid/cholesterol/gamma-HCH transport system substrate-binding protein
MGDNANYFKIGMFVIGATVIGTIAITVLGAGTLFQKTLVAETYFEESVRGLDTGSAVNFRGVKIGTIKNITLVDKEYATSYRYVLVRMALYPDACPVTTDEPIKKGLATEVGKGLRCRLTMVGLTGATHLEVDYLDAQGNSGLKIDWEPRYCYIPSVSSRITQLNEALARIMKALEDINIPAMAKTLESTLGLLAKTSEEFDLKGIGDKAGLLLTDLRETNRRLDEILGGREIRSILEDGSALVAAGRGIVEDSKASLERLEAGLLETSASMEGLARKLATISEGIPENLISLKRTLHRLDGFLGEQQNELGVILSNIRLISENIRDLSENAKQYPSQLLLGVPPPPLKGDKVDER